DGGRCVRPTLGCDQVDRQSAVSWAEPPGDDPDDIRRLPAAQPGLPYRGKARSEEYALMTWSDRCRAGQLPADRGQAFLETFAIRVVKGEAGLVQQEGEPILGTKIDMLGVYAAAAGTAICVRLPGLIRAAGPGLALGSPSFPIIHSHKITN